MIRIKKSNDVKYKSSTSASKLYLKYKTCVIHTVICIRSEDSSPSLVNKTIGPPQWNAPLLTPKSHSKHHSCLTPLKSPRNTRLRPSVREVVRAEKKTKKQEQTQFITSGQVFRGAPLLKSMLNILFSSCVKIKALRTQWPETAVECVSCLMRSPVSVVSLGTVDDPWKNSGSLSTSTATWERCLRRPARLRVGPLGWRLGCAEEGAECWDWRQYGGRERRWPPNPPSG